VADGWCWFVLREKYCWLVVDDWFVMREKYCWLVADKTSEQAASCSTNSPKPHRVRRRFPTTGQLLWTKSLLFLALNPEPV
jgi:hypothetical protein